MQFLSENKKPVGLAAAGIVALAIISGVYLHQTRSKDSKDKTPSTQKVTGEPPNPPPPKKSEKKEEKEKNRIEDGLKDLTDKTKTSDGNPGNNPKETADPKETVADGTTPVTPTNPPTGVIGKATSEGAGAETLPKGPQTQDPKPGSGTKAPAQNPPLLSEDSNGPKVDTPQPLPGTKVNQPEGAVVDKNPVLPGTGGKGVDATGPKVEQPKAPATAPITTDSDDKPKVPITGSDGKPNVMPNTNGVDATGPKVEQPKEPTPDSEDKTKDVSQKPTEPPTPQPDNSEDGLIDEPEGPNIKNTVLAGTNVIPKIDATTEGPAPTPNGTDSNDADSQDEPKVLNASEKPVGNPAPQPIHSTKVDGVEDEPKGGGKPEIKITMTIEKAPEIAPATNPDGKSIDLNSSKKLVESPIATESDGHDKPANAKTEQQETPDTSPVVADSDVKTRNLNASQKHVESEKAHSQPASSTTADEASEDQTEKSETDAVIELSEYIQSIKTGDKLNEEFPDGLDREWLEEKLFEMEYAGEEQTVNDICTNLKRITTLTTTDRSWIEEVVATHMAKRVAFQYLEKNDAVRKAKGLPVRDEVLNMLRSTESVANVLQVFLKDFKKPKEINKKIIKNGKTSYIKGYSKGDDFNKESISGYFTAFSAYLKSLGEDEVIIDAMNKLSGMGDASQIADRFTRLKHWATIFMNAKEVERLVSTNSGSVQNESIFHELSLIPKCLSDSSYRCTLKLLVKKKTFELNNRILEAQNSSELISKISSIHIEDFSSAKKLGNYFSMLYNLFDCFRLDTKNIFRRLQNLFDTYDDQPLEASEYKSLLVIVQAMIGDIPLTTLPTSYESHISHLLSFADIVIAAVKGKTDFIHRLELFLILQREIDSTLYQRILPVYVKLRAKGVLQKDNLNDESLAQFVNIAFIEEPASEVSPCFLFFLNSKLKVTLEDIQKSTIADPIRQILINASDVKLTFNFKKEVLKYLEKNDKARQLKGLTNYKDELKNIYLAPLLLHIFMSDYEKVCNENDTSPEAVTIRKESIQAHFLAFSAYVYNVDHKQVVAEALDNLAKMEVKIADAATHHTRSMYWATIILNSHHIKQTMSAYFESLPKDQIIRESLVEKYLSVPCQLFTPENEGLLDLRTDLTAFNMTLDISKAKNSSELLHILFVNITHFLSAKEMSRYFEKLKFLFEWSQYSKLFKELQTLFAAAAFNYESLLQIVKAMFQESTLHSVSMGYEPCFSKLLSISNEVQKLDDKKRLHLRRLELSLIVRREIDDNLYQTLLPQYEKFRYLKKSEDILKEESFVIFLNLIFEASGPNFARSLLFFLDALFSNDFNEGMIDRKCFSGTTYQILINVLKLRELKKADKKIETENLIVETQKLISSFKTNEEILFEHSESSAEYSSEEVGDISKTNQDPNTGVVPTTSKANNATRTDSSNPLKRLKAAKIATTSKQTDHVPTGTLNPKPAIKSPAPQNDLILPCFTYADLIDDYANVGTCESDDSKLIEELNKETSTHLNEDITKAKGPYRSRIFVHKGDISKLGVDAIANAANEKCLGGGGIDGAIHAACGAVQLANTNNLRYSPLKDRVAKYFAPPSKDLEKKHILCPTGTARVISVVDFEKWKSPFFMKNGKYTLDKNIKFILQAVGPDVHNDLSNVDEYAPLLRSAYLATLINAKKAGARHVSLNCISTAKYGYPKDKAAEIAIRAVRDWMTMEENKDCNLKVVFVLYPTDYDSQIEYYRKNIEEFFPFEE